MKEITIFVPDKKGSFRVYVKVKPVTISEEEIEAVFKKHTATGYIYPPQPSMEYEQQCVVLDQDEIKDVIKSIIALMKGEK